MREIGSPWLLKNRRCHFSIKIRFGNVSRAKPWAMHLTCIISFKPHCSCGGSDRFLLAIKGEDVRDKSLQCDQAGSSHPPQTCLSSSQALLTQVGLKPDSQLSKGFFPDGNFEESQRLTCAFISPLSVGWYFRKPWGRPRRHQDDSLAKDPPPGLTCVGDEACFCII